MINFKKVNPKQPFPELKENIKHLVFDFGNVLLGAGSLEGNIKILDPDFNYSSFQEKYKNDVKKANFENTDIIYEKIIKHSNKKLSIKNILEEPSKNANFNLLKQIPQLSKKYKLHIFSNCTPNFIKTFLKMHNIESYFENVIQSCDEGTAKPNKDFYEILFKKCNIIPKESLFFDDKKENIEVGESLGMKGVHFIDLNTNIESEINKII